MKNAKGLFLLALLLAAALVLGGCRKAAENASSSPQQTSGETGESTTPSASPTDIVPASGYQFEEKTYADGVISLKYPQIKNLSDTEKQDKLNKLIYEAAMRDLDEVKSSDMADYEMTYAVTYNSPDVISISFDGYSEVTGAAHPNLFLYAVTIDAKNVKAVKLKDLVKIDESFVTALINGTYSSMGFDMTDDTRDAIREVLGGMDTESWLEQLKNADTSGWATASYLTDEGLMVSVSVPHVMGDHVEILLTYQQLTAFKTSSPIWQAVGTGD
ncbi:DUF4163 domain-containing protein [Oscillospiraceae bacterium CM]|nr:DUF4163 domain-containing protein [Oscillospiraceae bacterium CM]